MAVAPRAAATPSRSPAKQINAIDIKVDNVNSQTIADIMLLSRAVEIVQPAPPAVFAVLDSHPPMRCRGCARLTAGCAACGSPAPDAAGWSSTMGAGVPPPRRLTFPGSLPPGSLPRRKKPKTEPLLPAAALADCGSEHTRLDVRRPGVVMLAVQGARSWDPGPGSSSEEAAQGRSDPHAMHIELEQRYACSCRLLPQLGQQSEAHPFGSHIRYCNLCGA